MASQQDEGWHSCITEAIQRRFESSPLRLFGVDHALDVEKMALRLFKESEYSSISEKGKLCVRVAALLHDIGFSVWKETWSAACSEHIEAGQGLTREILQEFEPFSGEPSMVDKVVSLVGSHDDTTYSYPWASNQGTPVRKKEDVEDCDLPPLMVLREADALVHVGGASVEDQIAMWVDRGIPRVNPHSAPLTSWMWFESVVGNIRLLAKRAIVDAKTDYGTEEALEAYERLEQHVRYQCSLSDCRYEREVCPPQTRKASLERLSGANRRLTMLRFHDWRSLEEKLRACHLLHDREIHPYRHARIRTQVVDIRDLAPLSLYVVKQRLREVLELHDILLAQYCLGLWDLPGLLEYTYITPEEQLLAPPVVERYTETAWKGHPLVNGILDGLHRCHMALDMEFQSIRVIVVSEVPYPPLPLPVTWDEVKTLEKPPRKPERRRLRYKRIEDYPGSFQTSVDITSDNVSYFLYRDLGILGSRGPRARRPFPEDERDRKA